MSYFCMQPVLLMYTFQYFLDPLFLFLTIVKTKANNITTKLHGSADGVIMSQSFLYVYLALKTRWHVGN